MGMIWLSNSVLPNKKFHWSQKTTWYLGDKVLPCVMKMTQFYPYPFYWMLFGHPLNRLSTTIVENKSSQIHHVF